MISLPSWKFYQQAVERTVLNYFDKTTAFTTLSRRRRLEDVAIVAKDWLIEKLDNFDEQEWIQNDNDNDDSFHSFLECMRWTLHIVIMTTRTEPIQRETFLRSVEDQLIEVFFVEMIAEAETKQRMLFAFYKTVFQVYTNAEMVEEAEQWLGHIVKQQPTLQASSSELTKLFNTVLQCYVGLGNLKRAEELLWRSGEKPSNSSQTLRLMPDLTSYQIVILTLVREQNHRAKKVWQHMKDQHPDWGITSYGVFLWNTKEATIALPAPNNSSAVAMLPILDDDDDDDDDNDDDDDDADFAELQESIQNGCMSIEKAEDVFRRLSVQENSGSAAYKLLAKIELHDREVQALKSNKNITGVSEIPEREELVAKEGNLLTNEMFHSVILSLYRTSSQLSAKIATGVLRKQLDLYERHKLPSLAPGHENFRLVIELQALLGQRDVSCLDAKKTLDDFVAFLPKEENNVDVAWIYAHFFKACAQQQTGISVVSRQAVEDVVREAYANFQEKHSHAANALFFGTYLAALRNAIPEPFFRAQKSVEAMKVCQEQECVDEFCLLQSRLNGFNEIL